MTEKSSIDSPSRLSHKLQQAHESKSPWLNLDNLSLRRVPEEVFDLPDLEDLDLSYNAIRRIPERLWDLPRLRNVILIGNPIEVVPDRPRLILDQSTYLRCRDQLSEKNTVLYLDPAITDGDATFWINELVATRTLHGLMIGQWISYPDRHPSYTISYLLASLRRLNFLESLSLVGMELQTVPDSIRHLTQLKHLRLGSLKLNHLPDWISDWDLESFSAPSNSLRELPDSLSKLKNLRHLNLSWNPLGQIPEWVFHSTSLENLHMRSCQIREIPKDILRPPRLKYIDVAINAIESPPWEVAKRGLDAIRDYWRQRVDTGVDYLCEAKLIVVGEAGAGKTSLARKIKNPDYELRNDEESTEGIDVIHYEFPSVIRPRENKEQKALQRDFRVNIWDFGGQEIYHATHQFFLTRRSVYVLVCDDRKENTDFSYWLQVVEMLSDGSPLLIVQNEKHDRTRDINLSSLRARFSNLCGSFATNLQTKRGLNEVIAAIRKELENLPHVGVGLPATWKRVRTALEQDQRDYISLEEYLTICQQHGFTRREDKLQLSGYLHDLGICLHFQDDPLLKNTVVLKPAWGTDAVYRVLDDKEVVSARGQFTRKQLDRIWSEEKYAGMQDELLRLMMKFQLCYELDTGGAYIAPQLLSSEQPSYSWEATGGLVVRYEYSFLPKGIITRFIVAMHRLIAGEKLVWKTGVVLERDGSRAEVIEEYSNRTIRVRVSDPAPHGLLAIIDEHLDRLHSAFPRLQYERYLPCPCSECQLKLDPYGFPLTKLIKMGSKGQQIQCHSSGEMVEAEQLVQDVLPGALRRSRFSPLNEVMSSISPPKPEVFVSYAWSSESNAIVDKLEQSLQEHGIRLIRDREEVRYKDSIRDFMRRIGQGKAVVVVISEKYLKSENCMFEMVEVVKAQSLRERVFPIVLSDANIYKATGRIGYVKYWESEIRELDEAFKTVRADNLTNLHDDLDTYSEIRRLFDGIADTLRDMNVLTPDQHEGSGFDELISRIRAQLGV